MNGFEKLMALLMGLVAMVAALAIISQAVIEVSHGWFDGGYVTINGHDMRCVVLQVTQTETAASCDWESIR